jgi:hypothetical protein
VFVKPRTTPRRAAVPCVERASCLGRFRAVLNPCRSTRVRVVAVRTPAPKAEASLLEHHRRLPVVSLGTAMVRCRRRTPRSLILGAGLRAEQLCFGRDSRTRCQPGQAHPSADLSCGLHRDTTRMVAGRVEPRAARRAWAPRCVARGCWHSPPPSGRPEPTQTPFPGSTSSSPPGASPARARAAHLKSRAADGVSLVTG